MGKRMFYHLDIEKLGARVKAADDARTQAEAAALEAATQAEEAGKMLAELVKGSEWRGAFAALVEAVRDHEREQCPRGRPMSGAATADHHERLYQALDHLLTRDLMEGLPLESALTVRGNLRSVS